MPCTTACSPYTMTLPGADTMKGGIIGDDCFRFRAGAAPVVEGTMEGIFEANCARAESTGESSAVCADCDGGRCWCVTAVQISHDFKIAGAPRTRTDGVKQSWLCERCR